MTDDMLFLEYFRGRSDRYAQQQVDGSYRPVHGRFGPQQLDEQRAGDATYGFYTVLPDNTTHLLVWDIDTGRLEDAERIQDALEGLGIEPDQVWTEWSGRKGYHVWCFLDGAQPADVAYKAVRAVLQSAGLEGTEAYPKQPRLDPDKPYGNLIKSPFTIHLGSGKRSTAVPPGRSWAVRRVSAQQLREVADEYIEPDVVEAQEAPENGWKKELPCIVRIKTGVGRGMRDNAMYTLARECRRQGLSKADTQEVCSRANELFQPPMRPFEVKQKVDSAYTGRDVGFQCNQPFLHQEQNLLCSKRCPRYPHIEGMPATEDAPAGSAGGGGRPPAGGDLKVGDELTLVIKSKKTRKDGATVVVLSYPGADDAVVVLKEDV